MRDQSSPDRNRSSPVRDRSSPDRIRSSLEEEGNSDSSDEGRNPRTKSGKGGKKKKIRDTVDARPGYIESLSQRLEPAVISTPKDSHHYIIKGNIKTILLLFIYLLRLNFMNYSRFL